MVSSAPWSSGTLLEICSETFWVRAASAIFSETASRRALSRSSEMELCLLRIAVSAWIRAISIWPFAMAYRGLSYGDAYVSDTLLGRLLALVGPYRLLLHLLARHADFHLHVHQIGFGLL